MLSRYLAFCKKKIIESPGTLIGLCVAFVDWLYCFMIKKIKPNTRLTPIQKDFVSFIEKNRFGVASHSTGVGKTLSSIAAFLNLQNKGAAKRALVIVPAGLKSNFDANIKHFTTAKTKIISSAKDLNKPVKNADFVIVSYAMARKHKNKLSKLGFDAVIADEIHRAKDKTTMNYEVLRSIRPKIKAMIGLTATPAQNTVEEALNIYNIISSKPIRLSEFNRRFTIHRAKTLGEWLKQALLGIPASGEIKGFKKQRELSSMFKRVFHIVRDYTKDKPKVVEKTIYVPMGPVQRTVYRQALKHDLTRDELKLLHKKSLSLFEKEKEDSVGLFLS